MSCGEWSADSLLAGGIVDHASNFGTENGGVRLRSISSRRTKGISFIGNVSGG